jgi:hypothetical protein
MARWYREVVGMCVEAGPVLGFLFSWCDSKILSEDHIRHVPWCIGYHAQDFPLEAFRCWRWKLSPRVVFHRSRWVWGWTKVAVDGGKFPLLQAYKHPEWRGPWLGPRPSEENRRDWSEEQLRAGETMIGLQAGSNKGATQAGQSFGATRKILLGK